MSQSDEHYIRFTRVNGNATKLAPPIDIL